MLFCIIFLLLAMLKHKKIKIWIFIAENIQFDTYLLQKNLGLSIKYWAFKRVFCIEYRHHDFHGLTRNHHE